MNGNWKRRGIAWLLTVAMLMTTVGNNWLLGSAAENDDTVVSAVQTEESSTEAAAGDTADGAEETSGGEEISLTDVFTYGEEELTWAQAGRILAGLLGFIEEDGANVDLTAYADRISSLSLDDDSFYLAILAENGYLDGVSEVIDPSAVISEETYESLLTEALAATAFTQEDAEALVTQEEPENLAISGAEIFLNAYEAGRIVLGENDSLELSSVTAQVISVTDADAELDLDATEIERVLVNGGADAAAAGTEDAAAESAADDAAADTEDAAADDTTDGEDAENAENADDADVEDSARLYIHIDSESGLPEVLLEEADDVVIEGSGSLGVVRVTGEVNSLTVRATGSVINETDEDFTVTGPDHEKVTLAPGEQVEFVLTGYLVSFRTEGTPVESQTVTPGGAVDFTSAQTELDGMIFTAWYTDEERTQAWSSLDTVDEELTLYANFIDEADAVTVTFETFGGRELEPLVFAKGETLLTRDIQNIYTSKEGYTFGGWCVDEDCTEAFSYTAPIEESMTLYALYASNEVVEEEDFGTVAELDDLDWQAGIALVLPDDMTFLEAMTSVEIEAGTGGEEPSLSFRETDGGVEVYGSYYEDGGESGFEPGATFTLKVSNGVQFDGYEDYIDTLTVSIYKDTVETVTFTDGLTWVLWENVDDYVQPSDDGVEYEVELSEDETLEEGETEAEVEDETIPGTLILTDDSVNVEVGDIVVFYDGEVSDEEINISVWEEGSFDGYVLYAEISAVEETAGGRKISFVYANPADFLDELDVHTTREVDLEDALGEDTLAQLERAIEAQVSANEELSAQLLVSVMSAQETQDELDELYGAGTYSLAALSASIKVNSPSVKLSSKDSTVTAGITVSATVKLKDGSKTVLTVKPALTFEQAVTVNTSIDGGAVWIDMSVTIQTKSTIRLEVTASSGGDTDVLSDAKETLETLVSPDGLDDSIDYDESASQLMETMQSLIATQLSYNDLFSVTLLYVQISFYGIISFSVQLDFVGQIGVLATFGVEIIVTNGQRIGFNYNFLKFKGGSFKEKLPGGVTTNIYVVGKVGVRLGLRLTLSVSLCGIAKASIIGEIFAYAELTGMYYFTAELISGSSTGVGALYFEVGLDAAVKLSLSVNLLIKTVKKSWTVWSDRWPLYSLSRSGSLSYMDVEKLDAIWEMTTTNADKKASFGFSYVPMKTWDLMSGELLQNEFLWTDIDAGKVDISLEIENVTVNGEAVAEDAEEANIFYLGDGTNGSVAGYVYANETLAAEYMITEATCDVVIVYEDSATSALVKRQEHVFELAKKFEMATTTVNVDVVLYDWCSHAWGIEAASWDGSTLYSTTFTTTHALGTAAAPTDTGEMDLAAIEALATSTYSDIDASDLSWFDPTRNSLYGAVEYSVPVVSSFCYLTPDTGTVRYDVRTNTDEYTLTFYLYARRYEGYDSDITYIVRLIGETDSEYAFSVSTGTSELSFIPSSDTAQEWSLETVRTAFDGTARALMMSVDQGTKTNTGYSITGREKSNTVIFEINLEQDAAGYTLTIVPGEGIAGFTIDTLETVTDEAADGTTDGSTDSGTEDGTTEAGTEDSTSALDTVYTSSLTVNGVALGGQVELSAELKEGYKNFELVLEPTGTEYTLTEDGAVFAMPRYDLTATLQAYKTSEITFEYNYGDLGTYTSTIVAANETVQEPDFPAIEGMTFRGWYTDADCSGEAYVFGSAPTGNLTLYADWTCDVTIVFGNVAGEAIYLDENDLPVQIFEGDTTEYYRFTYSTQRVGEQLLDISLPNYSGYDFMGWYLTSDFSGEAVDLETWTLSGGVTLYAWWVQFVSLTYDWNDGETGAYYETAEHLAMNLEDIPADPEREHYTFTGWYSGTACREDQLIDLAAYLPQEDVTLYAGWTANEYTITYDLQGGTNAEENPTAYTVESAEITLAEPSRTGYEFAGWIEGDLDETIMTVTIPTGTSGDLTYTAVWTPVTYTITYNLVRGTVSAENPIEYTIESPDIVLVNPEKDSYIFEGWTGTDLEEATTTVTIPTGSIGDRSYKATWSTDDPAKQIADFAIDAAEGTYTFELDEFIEGTDEASSIYQSVRAAIDENEDSGPYKDDITLAMELDDVAPNPAEDETTYTWTYTATIVYTDDEGNEETRTGTVTAVVNKRVATVIWPTASDLAYGEALSESSLSGGSAIYKESEDTEVEVGGSFTWSDDTIIPVSTDNGSEIYTVIFTPDDTANYAVQTAEIAVATQIGVKVYITSADDRYYIAQPAQTQEGDSEYWTQTLGSYTLMDIDSGETLTAVTLDGGEYHFADNAVGTDKAVTFSGYTMTVAAGADAELSVYSLLDTETTLAADGSTVTASILQVPFSGMSVTVPTAGTITYKDAVGDIALNNDGKVTYTYDYSYYQGTDTIDGTWSWTNNSDTPASAGEQTFSVTFGPSDAGYESGTADLTANVEKKAVDAPTFTASVDYTGSKQTAGVSQTTLYTVTDDGGTAVGTYDVVLTLTDPANYCWSSTAAVSGTVSGSSSETLTMKFTITQAGLTVSGVTTDSVSHLSYGQLPITGTTPEYSTYNKDMVQYNTANRMISSDVKVTSEITGDTVEGSWSWKEASLTSLSYRTSNGYKYLPVRTSGDTLTAVFTPNDTTNYATVEQDFTIYVDAVTPDVSDVTLTASDVLAWTGVTLACSEITATGTARNPITGEALTLTWAWGDSTKVPDVGTKSYSATGTVTSYPSSYNTATSSASVEGLRYLTVTLYGNNDYDSSWIFSTSSTGDSGTCRTYTTTIGDPTGDDVEFSVYIRMCKDTSASGTCSTADTYCIESFTQQYASETWEIGCGASFGAVYSTAMIKWDNDSWFYMYNNSTHRGYPKLTFTLKKADLISYNNKHSVSVDYTINVVTIESLTSTTASASTLLNSALSLASEDADACCGHETELSDDAETAVTTGTDETADGTDSSQSSTTAETGSGQDEGTAESDETTAGADTGQSGGSAADTGTGDSGGTATDSDTGGSGETLSTEAQTEATTEKQTEPATEAQKSTEAQTEAATEKQTEPATEKQTEAQKSTEAQTEAATETQKSTEAQTEAATEATTATAETAIETQ